MSNTPNNMNSLVVAEQAVALAINLGTQLMPIIQGIIKDVQSRMNNGQLEYTVVISTGQASLDDADKIFNDVLDKINAERAKAGLEPIKNA